MPQILKTILKTSNKDPRHSLVRPIERISQRGPPLTWFMKTFMFSTKIFLGLIYFIIGNIFICPLKEFHPRSVTVIRLKFLLSLQATWVATKIPNVFQSFTIAFNYKHTSFPRLVDRHFNHCATLSTKFNSKLTFASVRTTDRCFFKVAQARGRTWDLFDFL